MRTFVRIRFTTQRRINLNADYVLWNDPFSYNPHRFPEGRNESTCHLFVIKDAEKALVIATELKENPGMSVTNSSEALATLCAAQFTLDPERTTFIEHYNAERSYGAKRLAVPIKGNSADNYSVVTYTWARKGLVKTASYAQWKYLTEEEYQALLKGFEQDEY
jgi:hypothetical protein